jgi:nucleotidyltransferase substrate binding protein (TIGR01987 family)
MSNEDIRWQQRYSNFLKAFTLFEEAVELSGTKKLSKLEEQGLIQRFEFTHELAWNVLKDYFEYQGNTSITGSRDATREAFNKGLVTDGEGWMEMIKSRNHHPIPTMMKLLLNLLTKPHLYIINCLLSLLPK